MESYLPYIRHAPVTEDEKAEVLKALDGPLTKGPYVEQLESLFREKYKKKHAIACSSGTAALYLAYGSFGLWTRATIPAITFMSTLTTYEEMWSTAEIIDVEPGSWCAVGEVKVDLGGYVPKGHAKVEDASHAFDSDGVGDARITCFSLHAIKNLGAGEGGMCVTDEDILAEYMYMAREPERVHNSFNWRMPEMTAALACARFNKTHKLERQLIRDTYVDELGDYLEFQKANGGECWHLCIATHPDMHMVESSFKTRNIQYIKHYEPLAPLPNAQRYWNDAVSLPFWPHMTEEEQGRVIEAVQEAF